MSATLRPLFDLTGKVAIVTGASKGIGESIARGLAEYGAKVIVSSRKQESVDAVAKSIRDTGYEATGVACHVGDMAALGRLVDATVQKYGGVDILVNNAATNPVFGALADAGDDAFEKIMTINLKAPLELAKRVRLSMAERGGGSILNISSIGGIRPEPMLGLYSVSKAALISMTQVMAREWGPDKIRVNVLCPGLIKTKFSAALWSNPDLLQRITEENPVGRIGEPIEMAGLALYLASPASSFCTGAVFVADGGSTIC